MYIAEQLMKFAVPYMMSPLQAELVSWLYVKIIWLFHFASIQLRFLPEDARLSYLTKLEHLRSQEPHLYPEALIRYQRYLNLIEEQLKEIS